MSKKPSSESGLIHRGRSGFEKGAEILRQNLRTMPEHPGVYRMLNEKNAVLYVGKAKNLKKRVSSYTQRARLPHRLQRMVAQIRSVEITVTRTEAEALLLEANFIQKLMPPFNVLLRDDKSYPYILIRRDHPFPQMLKHRGSKTTKGWYFGPFASAGAVAETLELMQRAFMLRNCSDAIYANRTRPCLQYHIKRCTAPCVKKVTADDYAEQVSQARAFLDGRSSELQVTLAEQMQAASDGLDFELAAKLRDRIKVLTAIQSRQDINVSGIGDADIIGMEQIGNKTCIQIFFFRADRNFGARLFYPRHDPQTACDEIMASFIAQFYTDKVPPKNILVSHKPEDITWIANSLSERADHTVSILVPKAGVRKRVVDHAIQNAKEALARQLADSDEQEKILVRVADLFGMHAAPKRIEVYDNSHISGQHAIGAMIAAGPEGFLKKTYRQFNIKQAEGNDDFAMMREVLTRRFQRLKQEDPDRLSGLWPDLVLIDGGEGQLGKVVTVFKELGIEGVTLVGIAKGPDRNAGRERFFMQGRAPFSLPHDDPALYYLQRLRDEAHRYAIGTHRARRTKAISQTSLDDVPGIGATRKKALLHHFGSGKAAAAAAVEELMRVPGISKAVAQKIYDYFRE